jgi:FG-GAP repeat
MTCKYALNTHILIVVSLLVGFFRCQVVQAQTSRQSVVPLFLPAVTYNSGGQGAMSVAVADVNGDGKPDLVVPNACSSSVGCSNTGPVGVLLGNGDGSFQPAVIYGSGGVTSSGIGSVTIADVNGDGTPRLGSGWTSLCGYCSSEGQRRQSRVEDEGGDPSSCP